MFFCRAALYARRERGEPVMPNRIDISGMKGLLVVVLATACVLATDSYAGSDEDAVKAAVAAYNAAVDSLDPAKIEAL